MKTKVIIFILTLFTGCANDTTTPDDDTTTPPDVDAVTTPSIVDKEADFEKAISNTGTWIICTLTDLTFDKELVLDGEFKNGKKDDSGNDIVQRKIALYTQDEERNVTERFTLTAPKLTINSTKASIQHGTFVGDLYVNVNDFQLLDNKVDGNVYFKTAEAQSTFTMDETSSITGTQELAPVSYTHLRAHETRHDLVCRLLLE